ncbi:hypothetical protein LOK49_Contig90G00002 [Camellia lanceoleosa]|nr:hypothetical protein LOK49_Contig90G00002 [Camellia lanceoleosa]
MLDHPSDNTIGNNSHIPGDLHKPSKQGKSAEEEDHLIRGTKKIKSSAVDKKDNMANVADMDTEVLHKDHRGQEAAALGPLPPKSFKKALATIKNNDYTFDSRVKILSSDKEDDAAQEGQSTIQNIYLKHRGLPTISLTKKLLENIRKPWENALIIRLLGKNIGYRMLCSRVKNIWGLQGEFNAIDLGSNYFLFKFSEQEDCAKVFT